MLNFEHILEPYVVLVRGSRFSQFRIYTILGYLYSNLTNFSTVVLENTFLKTFPPIYFYVKFVFFNQL